MAIKLLHFFLWVSFDNLCPSRDFSISSKWQKDVHHIPYLSDTYRICSNISFSILEISYVFSLAFFSLAKEFSILLIFSKNQFLFFQLPSISSSICSVLITLISIFVFIILLLFLLGLQFQQSIETTLIYSPFLSPFLCS